MDRASASGAEGWRFDPSRACQFLFFDSKMRKRVLVAYNPRSSKFLRVKTEVLDLLFNPKRLADELGIERVMMGKYEVRPTNVDENAERLAGILRPNDLVIAAGGDGTASIVANALMKCPEEAEMAVLGYGNFNDFARTTGKLKVQDAFREKAHDFYPLEVTLDGKLFRYAMCYVTMGLTAESVELFDEEKMRKFLQTGKRSAVRSYSALAKWYFSSRKKRRFLPEFELNGEKMSRKVTDYCAVNGGSMAGVMKGADYWKSPKTFQSETGELASFWNLATLMTKSIFRRVPGDETQSDRLEFLAPGKVEIQIEGEYKIFENPQVIEVKKAEKSVKIITR